MRNTGGSAARKPRRRPPESVLAVQKPVALDPRPLSARLATYQAERFPVATQGAFTALYALSCVCFGALARHSPQPPLSESIVIAPIVVFLFFFQLRVSDEHRDYDEDFRNRPELPVPSGVITLPELDVFALGAMAVQLVLTWALHPPLVALLFPPWLWIFLVRKDFFARDALEARPLLSLAAHLAFFPLTALYAIAADQLPVAGALSPGLISFTLLAAGAAAALEFARKCRAPDDERPGVVTYSALWGATRAGMAVALTLAVTLMLALIAFVVTRMHGLWFLPSAAVAFAAFLAAIRYAETPTRLRARHVLLWTGAWILAAYATLGIAPLVGRLAGETLR